MTASRYTLLLVLALSVAAIVACTQRDEEPLSCPQGWDQVTEYQLYFGRSDASGTPGAVSDQDWEQFLEDTVTPRFPDGLTVTDGSGQWRNESGEILREQSKVLTLLVWPDETARQRLDEIAAQYKSRFDQESVLLTSAQTCASFG
ncbi:MAG: DUF3574 domain-containing protein [Chloroflexota bacterium]|nr:DUF3574 domain-containing protein [Chloroflexota bacterium]